MDLKPIETEYNGYRFRSRLEARWAVFFDAAKIKYRYEPEGFEVKVGEDEKIRYLPDFYFPDFDMWAEVKPNKKKLLEDATKIAWCIDYGNTVISYSNGLIILGQIPYYDTLADFPLPAFNRVWWDEGLISGLAHFLIGNKGVITWNDFMYDSASGPDFPKLLSDDDLIYWTKCVTHTDNYSLKWSLVGHDLRDSNEELLKCFTLARQARFEHGETPTI